MANSLALSPLLYLASIIHVPGIVMREIKLIINDFIQNVKLACAVLIQDIVWFKINKLTNL